MRPGDELVLRESNERVVLVAVLTDAAGALLVATAGEAPFEVRRDDVMTLRERHASCGCC
jgi:hypothetical protein